MCFRGGKAPMLTAATCWSGCRGLLANDNKPVVNFRWQCNRQLVVVVDWRGIGGVERVKSFPFSWVSRRRFRFFVHLSHHRHHRHHHRATDSHRAKPLVTWLISLRAASHNPTHLNVIGNPTILPNLSSPTTFPNNEELSPVPCG